MTTSIKSFFSSKDCSDENKSSLFTQTYLVNFGSVESLRSQVNKNRNDRELLSKVRSCLQPVYEAAVYKDWNSCVVEGLYHAITLITSDQFIEAESIGAPIDTNQLLVELNQAYYAGDSRTKRLQEWTRRLYTSRISRQAMVLSMAVATSLSEYTLLYAKGAISLLAWDVSKQFSQN